MFSVVSKFPKNESRFISRIGSTFFNTLRICAFQNSFVGVFQSTEKSCYNMFWKLTEKHLWVFFAWLFQGILRNLQHFVKFASACKLSQIFSCEFCKKNWKQFFYKVCIILLLNTLPHEIAGGIKIQLSEKLPPFQLISLKGWTETATPNLWNLIKVNPHPLQLGRGEWKYR